MFDAQSKGLITYSDPDMALSWAIIGRKDTELAAHHGKQLKITDLGV